ncbi:hypothetical protein [Kumtagia ephedrae]|nr:hypothetical protein [Mesorhizobium ephedrae]
MEPWTLFAHLASALREFILPSYRPALYYMRGPGPATRRMLNRRGRM